MAIISPLPQGISAWVQPDGTPTNIFLQYMLSLDKSSRSFSSLSSSSSSSSTSTRVSASLSVDIALNAATYTDGPSINVGNAGTWLVSATCTFTDTAGARGINAKLWDGSTVIASTTMTTIAAGNGGSLSLSGLITSPSGNLRVSAIEGAGTTTSFKFNSSGNSKDCTISAIRIA